MYYSLPQFLLWCIGGAVCPGRRSTSVTSPCRVRRTLCIHGGPLNPRPLPLSGPYSVLPVEWRADPTCRRGLGGWQGIPIGRLPATSPGAFVKGSGSASTVLGRSAPQLATCSPPACTRRSSRPTSIRNAPLAACSAPALGGLPPLHVNCFGVIPEGPQYWRLITDLSYPPGLSVNDGIDPELCSLTYTSVDTVAEVAASYHPGALLAKVDIESAYRLIPVHPSDRPLQAMAWEGSVYVDPMLPFGLRSAPKIFNAVADGLEWYLRSRGIRHLAHYLDDFIIIGPPRSSECADALATLDDVCSRLGIPLAQHKRDGPTTCLTFLGVEVDTEAAELHLPQAKLERLRSILEDWGDRKVCGRRELESLVGVLNHAVWGQSWSGCRVTVLCDNQAVVACLRSRTCHDHHITHMLRTLAFIEASHYFALSPQYISTTDNHLADDLSRNCLSSFLSKVPDANRRETSLPGLLVELLLDPTLDWTSPQWLQRFSAIFKTGWHHPHAEPTTLR